jgi:hypothetical protein
MPKTETLDECVDRVLSFDEIAEVAIYLYADVARAKKAQPILRKAKDKCSETQPELKGKTCEALEAMVGWDGLYNGRVESVLDEFKVRTWVDEWGGKCWTDANGDHCGDQSGFYPFWDNEVALRKRLEEGKTPRE